MFWHLLKWLILISLSQLHCTEVGINLWKVTVLAKLFSCEKMFCWKDFMQWQLHLTCYFFPLLLKLLLGFLALKGVLPSFVIGQPQNSPRNLNSMLINMWPFNNGQWVGYEMSSKVMLLQECALKEPPEKQTTVVEKQALWKSWAVSSFPKVTSEIKLHEGIHTYIHNFAETQYLQLHSCISSKND